MVGRGLDYSEEVFEVCCADRDLFVLHPKFARANFYAQQVRILHLLKAMRKKGVVHKVERRELAIVGGGIAGLTAAAGALSMGLGVRLFEQDESLLSKYKQAIHREIHPNIISWPFNELRAVTNLPFLNWGFATADKVADRFLKQWNEHISRHASVVEAKVSGVVSDPDGAAVRLSTAAGVEYLVDAAIITVGFEREIALDGCDSPSYWVPRVFEERDPVWVSGIGDGGLIDAACQTYGVDATKAVRELAYRLDEKPHKEAIRRAEEEALAQFLSGDTEGSLEQLGLFYEKFGLEPEDRTPLDEHTISAPAPVNLVHQHASAYSPLTCPINKVLVSVMAEGESPKVVMRKGSISENDSGAIVLNTGEDEIAVDTSRFVVRHGAKHAGWDLLTDDQKDKLESANKEVLSKPVPDFLIDDWKEEFSVRQLIPDEWFADNFYEIVGEILSEAGYAKAQILREASSKRWHVNSEDISSRAVRSIFPIEMGEIIVSLTDSAPSEFYAL